jgi:hypothetical protein
MSTDSCSDEFHVSCAAAQLPTSGGNIGLLNGGKYVAGGLLSSRVPLR